MKRYLVLLLILALLPAQAHTQTMLRKGCDALYTEQIENILTQFMGVATPDELKEYKQFMLAVKLRNDLLFKITPIETKMLSNTRALLRQPLTNYTACRSHAGVAFGYDTQTVNPSKRVLEKKKKTYAALMQQTLNRLQVSPAKYTEYQAFMLLLKYYEDLGSTISEFERKTRYATRARLREPLVKYITCRDTLIHMQNKALPL